MELIGKQIGLGTEKGDFAIQCDPNLESICEPFDGMLLDAYGVFWGRAF